MEERREELALRVEDAMRAYRGEVLNIGDPISVALSHTRASLETFLLIRDGSGKWRGIERDELSRRASQIPNAAILRNLVHDDVIPHLHPDQPLDEALRRLGNQPFLPVVSRANWRKLEAVIALTDVLAAYRKAYLSRNDVLSEVE